MRALIRPLAMLIVGALVWRAPAQAQASRSIPRTALDPKLREQLDRGKLVKVSPTSTDTVTRTAAAVTLRPGEVVAARTGDSAVFRRTTAASHVGAAAHPATGARVDTVLTVPFTYLGMDRTGATLTYQPVFIREGMLRYSSTEDVFEGSFLIGLELLDTPGEERDLSREISMTFGGDADSIAPQSLAFKHTGGPTERVTVIARAPRDSIAVQIVPRFDTRGITVWLPVQRTLAFETPPKRMQGYGVESRLLKVVRRGTDARDTMAVAISSDRGTLSTSEIRVGPTGGEVTLRTGGGLGPAKVHAVAPGIQTGETIVTFAFPSLFLGASVAGGTTGAVIAELRRRRRKGNTSTMVRHVVGAVLGAIIATAVYLGLGVNLLAISVNLPLANEISVFAFAALGAMFGLKAVSGASGGKP